LRTVRKRLASLNERQTFADLRVKFNSRGVGEAYCPAMWTHSDSSETVTKVGSNGNERLRKVKFPRTARFTNTETVLSLSINQV